MSRIYTGTEAEELRKAATEGPWQVDGTRHSGDLKIGLLTRLHMVGPDMDQVAAVFFDMKTGKGLTDATLIAAGPDLCLTIEALEARAEAAEARCAVLEAKQALVEAAVVNLLTAARNDLQAMFEQGDTE